MATTDDDLTWEPPGAGTWTSLASHVPNVPTWWFRQFNPPGMEQGTERAFAKFGAPLRRMGTGFVNGRAYTRLVPLVMPNSNAKPPPPAVLWLITRLHPEFRRRNRLALAALEGKVWRGEVRRWHDELRPALVDHSRALQQESIGAYDDAALLDHIDRTLEHTQKGHVLHFELHASDMGPLGDLLAHCDHWGIGHSDAVRVLEGASPATTAPGTALVRLAELVASAPVAPATLDDVRALGDEASRLVDDYVAEYGWRIVTAYDVDGRALIELPEAILATLRVAAGPPRTGASGEAAAAELRERVPAADRDEFDELVAEARSVYGLRDDNGPITGEWPIGLLRRALLEAGRRLVDRGSLADPEHAVEIDRAELGALLSAGTGPSAGEITARAIERVRASQGTAPFTLGPEEAPPPVRVLPAGLARVTELVLHAVSALDAPAGLEPLQGVGVGDTPYKGTVRIAHQPEEVLCTMEPGDVLVASFTTPAYNTVLSIAGAIVVEEGGVLCHAAVMARELGIPAVVGASGAMTQLRDGSEVEVDPVAGRVRALT